MHDESVAVSKNYLSVIDNVLDCLSMLNIDCSTCFQFCCLPKPSGKSSELQLVKI